MITPAAPARTTMRGFQGTPAASGDEDSDYGGTRSVWPPRTQGSGSGSSSTRRGRAPPVIHDVVSANCSPVIKPAASPGVGGIARLRLKVDALSLDSASSSRANSMTRSDSRQRILSPLATPTRTGTLTLTSGDGAGRERSGSSNASSDETADGTTSYEIDLEDDFASESPPERRMLAGAIEGGLVAPRRKMTAGDFEPLRCLGKGTYGTVLLVKQHSTGRLFAQKQFKKASLVVRRKLIEQTKTERQILESVNRHPFVVKLYYAFQDLEKLYLILEYGQGGELFTHLNHEKMFSEAKAAFYMGEMALALWHLHDTLGVVYRDLKPENCLLDAEGHLLLTDFGLSKVAVDADSCHSILGTVEYMAPEVILGQKYGKAVDWWSFGALAFDLMTGSAPFRGRHTAQVQDNIVKQKLALPYYLSSDAKDLLTRLLRKDPKKRLGAVMPRDLEAIKKHRFFRHIDWRKLAAREVEPPIQPLITDPELAENFADEFTELALSPVVTSKDPWASVLSASARELLDCAKEDKDDPFRDFSYVASNSLLEGHGFPFAERV